MTAQANGRRYDQAAREEMIRLYRGGMIAPDIARRFGCAVGTVYRALDRAGVPRRHYDDSFMCPVCGRAITSRLGRFHYCPYCGRRIL